MPPKQSRPQSAHRVTAVLVSHDGSRWLGDCLRGLTGQTRPPERVVAVDTGSVDGAGERLADALGESAVVRLDRSSGFGVAVAAGLDAFHGAAAALSPHSAQAAEWVWLLHDDCAPEPSALAELLVAADHSPSVAAWGPKVLSWDGRRLREVGLTVDSSGRTRTGLETRELDQGQHDDAGDVLAVGTAGMLVRRDVWDAVGGLDARWPLFGEDVDFGWRLAAHGERVRVAPNAVVRHAAGLRTHRRAADAVSGPPGMVARRNGMEVVLANTATALVPLLVLRYVAECLLRAVLLLLLARRPRAARDEVAALVEMLGRLGGVVEARRRRTGRTVGYTGVRPLLAPVSWRWRVLGDVFAAMFGGRSAAEGRRRRRAPVETGPVSDEAESLDLGGGALAALVRRPGFLLTLALTAVGLVAARHVLGTALHGGRLLPAARGSADLWSTYLQGWHPVDLGSTADAPPSLAALGAFSWLLFGKVWLAVVVLLLGAVPLAGLSAYLAAGAVTRDPRLRVWGATTYAVLPALSGAIAGGRLDVVVAMILLPVTVRAVASSFAVGPPAPERAFGAGLLLALTAAFAPVVWLVAAAALLVVSFRSLVAARQRVVRTTLTSVVILAVSLLALLPWSFAVIREPRLLLVGMGLPEQLRSLRPLGSADVLLLHPGGPAQPPLWVFGPLVLVMLVGLTRARHVVAARLGLLLFLLGGAGALAVSRLSGPDPAAPAIRYWTGGLLAVAGLGAVLAAVVAADRARAVLRAKSFGWRQPAALAMTVAVLVGTAAALVGLLVRGTDRPLTADAIRGLPVFAAAEVGLPTSPRVLALAADHGVVRYAVVRRPTGVRLGDAEVGRPGHPVVAARLLAEAVREAAAGQASAVSKLAEFDVSMLVVPGADAHALRGLADVDGLSQVPTSGATVWRTGKRVGELVIVQPTSAAVIAAGGALPAAARPRPLAASPGAASVPVPAGATGRLLVLAEPADPRWRATVSGTRLPSRVAYGWAQAWTLPASGGRLEVSRTGGHRGWWLTGELVVVLAAVLLSIPTGRRTRDGSS